jgi:hypothetical protein
VNTAATSHLSGCQVELEMPHPLALHGADDIRDTLLAIDHGVLPGKRFRRRLPLYCCFTTALPDQIEERHHGAPGDHGVRDLVSVLLVWITRTAVEAAFELDSAPLLHDVRGLMCCGVDVGRTRERHCVTRRICASAELLARLPSPDRQPGHGCH